MVIHTCGKPGIHAHVLAGALIDEGDDALEAAFRQAVDMVNADRTILVRTRLIGVVEKIPKGDSFKASKKGLA